MAKTDYLISGVWKNSKDVITHVFLHEMSSDSTFKKGIKTLEADVIKLINNSKKVIFTITWDYPDWNWGAPVDVVNSSYLRTDRNKTAKDNLDNLIKMDSLI